MSFFSKSNHPKKPEDAAAALRLAIEQQMQGVDEATIRIVSAVAGLLGAVAYADKVFVAAEVEHVRASISRIHGMTPQATSTICGLLSRHMAEFAALHTHTFARDLKTLTEPHVRREVLDVLVDLAAVDGEISLPEVNLLRQLTTSLGLTQDDYNDSQSRHRDKLVIPT